MSAFGRAASLVRRLGRLVAPSLVAAALAAFVAGLVEGVWYSETGAAWRVALTGIGYAGIYSVSLGVAVLVAVRLLWRGWRVAELLEAERAANGGVPRIAAWVCFVVSSVVVLGAASAAAVYLVAPLRETALKALVVAAAAVFVGLLIAVLSRPVVGILATTFAWLDQRWGRASLFSPRRVVAIAALVAACAVAFSFFGLARPLIGPLRIVELPYIVVYLLALLAVLRAWSWRRLRPWLGGVCLACALLSATVATDTRYRRPYTMLDAWADLPVGGRSIALTHDLAAIRRNFSTAEIAPVPRRPAPHPDVILLTIDTVRADRTQPYGGSAETPGLAAVADGAVLFERAYSPSNVTRRSLPSIATGLSPSRVRGRVVGWALRFDQRHVTIGERFRAAGYDTAGIVCCDGIFSRDYALGPERGLDQLIVEFDGAKLVSRAMAWLRARGARSGRKPFFLWLHVYEPHRWDQLYPPSEFGRPIKPRYDRVLADTDRLLRPLYDLVTTPERRKDTVFVVTSDHGESLGDHGAPAHSTTLFNTELHVPLIVAAPSLQPRRVPRSVSLVDLAPTLLDLAGFEPPGMPEMDGRSLVPYMGGGGAAGEGAAVVAVMIRDRSTPSSLSAVITDRYKLIVGPDAGRRRLYDLEQDPRERHDVAKENPAIVERLAKRLVVQDQINRIAPF